MSKPSTSYRLFYPDTNTVTDALFHDPSGAVITPASVADGTDDPPGFKSKVIALATAAELLFALPTFADAANPVPVYLTRDEGGAFYKALDELLFDPLNPGRPTVGVTAAQEYRLFETTSTHNGGNVYTVKAPTRATVLVNARGKDPVTGEPISGNDILFRWFGPVPDAIEIEADVEDIADPRGFVPVPVTNATTYAESSVGLSLVQTEDQIVPRDGLGHTVNFRLRYNVGGDPSEWTTVTNQLIKYDMDPPLPPQRLTATLLRDRNDVIPDVVQLDWELDPERPGTGVQIFCTTYLGKKHALYTSDSPATSVRLENISRFVVQDQGPPVARPYRFHIVATNVSGKSSETYAAPALEITSRVKATPPPTPDEIAGTARDVAYAVLKAEVFADVLSAIGALPAEGQAVVNAAIDHVVLKIKDVLAKGGSVELDDFGLFAAKWTKERLGRNPATGEPVITPAYRSLSFTPSIGFKTGTRNGTLMTDYQARPNDG